MSAPYFHGDVMTRREVLIAREAANRTIESVFANVRTVGLEACDFRGYAVLHWPLPQVERPRVATDSDGRQWRVVDNIVMYLGVGGEWIGIENISATPERVAMCADLFANPTEIVDDEVQP